MAIRRKGKYRTIAHILTSVVIILHGFEKMEKDEGSYWIFFLAGIVFLLVVALHKTIAAKFKSADSILHMIEALVLFVIAYDYFHHGKTALPLCYLGACLGHVIAAFFLARKGM